MQKQCTCIMHTFWRMHPHTIEARMRFMNAHTRIASTCSTLPQCMSLITLTSRCDSTAPESPISNLNTCVCQSCECAYLYANMFACLCSYDPAWMLGAYVSACLWASVNACRENERVRVGVYCDRVQRRLGCATVDERCSLGRCMRTMRMYIRACARECVCTCVCVDVCVSVPATPACGNAGEHACVHECMPIYMHACVSAWYAVLGWAGLSCSLLRDAVR